MTTAPRSVAVPAASIIAKVSAFSAAGHVQCIVLSQTSSVRLLQHLSHCLLSLPGSKLQLSLQSVHRSASFAAIIHHNGTSFGQYVVFGQLTFSRNAMLAGTRFGPFVGKRKFSVFGQTQICRFRPNTSFPFTAKRKFGIFGQTQVCRLRPNASLPFSAKHKLTVFGKTQVYRSRPNTNFGQCQVLANRQIQFIDLSHIQSTTAPTSIAVPVAYARSSS